MANSVGLPVGDKTSLRNSGVVLRVAVARSHSAISPNARPQPVQTLALALMSSVHISLQGDGGRSVKAGQA